MIEVIEPLEAAARYFRLGMDGAGSDCLVHFIDAFMALLCDETFKGRAEELADSFGEVIEAQLRGDTLRIADLLEYTILPVLKK